MAAPSPETREQANRRKLARCLADAMRKHSVCAESARLGGDCPKQFPAAREFRMYVALWAGSKTRYDSATGEYRGYIPSDATWQLACDMLEVTR